MGSERSGVYNSGFVRGFDPVDAGNTRVEGLYFDQIDALPGRIVAQTAIKVGIAAQGYAFPAPSGLVDYALRKPGAHPYARTEWEAGRHSGGLAQAEFAFPLGGEGLGLAGGLGRRWRRDSSGETVAVSAVGMLARWVPGKSSEIVAFGGVTAEASHRTRLGIVPAGGVPGKIERGRSLAQPWALQSLRRGTVGFLARIGLGDVRAEAALFHAKREQPEDFSDVASGVMADGRVTERYVIAERGSEERSTSGELRLVHAWRAGPADHRLIVSARARRKLRRFGGSQRIALGTSTVLAPDWRAAPEFEFGPKSRDEVRQVLLGASYSLQWNARLGVDLGVSRSHYEKDTQPAPALPGVSAADSRLVWNASLSYALSQHLTVYGGLTRGLEEASAAPDRAINRSEAPLALATSQAEAGIRLALVPGVTFAGGAFRLSKPYYNLDPGGRYRELGVLAVLGVETSLAGEILPGLRIVAGTVFMRPRVSGEIVAAGTIAPVPVGQMERRTAIDIQWQLQAGRSPLSLDLALESGSSSFADNQNRIMIPGYLSVDLGARLRFAAAGADLVLRPKVENLFNEFSWRVSRSGSLTYSRQRSYSLQLSAEF